MAHALVAYIAQNTTLELCAASLAELVKRHLPEAELLGEGRVRIDGKILDTWARAWYKRGGAHEEIRSTEPALVHEYEAALAGWTMPDCPACRGRAVGHTCGPDCQNPHKEWLVIRRGLVGLGPPSAWDSSWRWPPKFGDWGGSVRIVDRQWVLSTGLPSPWEVAAAGAV